MGTLTEPCQSRAVWRLGSGGGRGLCLFTDPPLTSQEPQEALTCLQCPWNGAEEALGQRHQSEAQAKVGKVGRLRVPVSCATGFFCLSMRSSAFPSLLPTLGSSLLAPYTGSSLPSQAGAIFYTGPGQSHSGLSSSHPVSTLLFYIVTCSRMVLYLV